MELEYSTFVRKPFVVEAVQITAENISEIAKHVGRVRFNRGTNEKYIQVNPNLVANLEHVYIGFWMTKMDGNTRCYANRVFLEQFVGVTPEIAALIDSIDREGRIAADG